MSSDFRKVEKLCQAALDLEESRRAAFLEEACAGDEELRQKVESLLKFEKPPADVVFDLPKDEDGSVPAIYFLMNEDDVRASAMQVPWVSIGSDGTAESRPDGVLGRGKPHPRWYGTFPRVLGRYVREEKVLALEEAVKKMTLLNAQKLGLENRGLLKAGYKADITIFNADRVIDKATFENPHQYPEGVEYVIVNGTIVLDQGKHLEAKPGKILFGKGKK